MLSAAADGVEAASSSLECLLMPRRVSPAPWAASVSVFPRAAREAPLVASACCVFRVVWEFLVSYGVLFTRLMHNVVLPFRVFWIP
jgi:hypothetical protein